MNIQENLLIVTRAALFALIAIGGLGTGLGIATLTVEKANELVFSQVAESSRVDQDAICPLLAVDGAAKVVTGFVGTGD